MKAIVFYEHGGPEVLRYEDVEAPAVGPGEVAVQVKAAALNRLDLFVREGWPGIKLALPHIPGADAAGVVLATGEGVDPGEVTTGDRVAINPNLFCGHCEFCIRGEDQLCTQHSILGEHLRGTYAEQVVVPAANVIRLPEHVTYTEAAAFSLVGVTAWHMLITRGRLRAGEDVLIIGAGGGLNTVALQVARLAGARVLVVGSNAEKLARAQALGAEVLIDRSQQDWSKAVYAATGRRGVDVVVDNVGQATWMGSIRALRKGGRMLVVGNTSGPHVDLDVRYIFAKQIGILGSTMGGRADYRAVMRQLFQGRLKAVIDAELPLSEARAAQEMLTAGEVFGKVVLKPEAD
jgi:NADPH:quinone reductase-like Zn-dependent oxidoreductase